MYEKEVAEIEDLKTELKQEYIKKVWIKNVKKFNYLRKEVAGDARKKYPAIVNLCWIFDDAARFSKIFP